MIPDQQIEHIKQAADDYIISIVEKYVKLKRSGSSYKGLCPFHEESTPSFSVSEKRGIYKCFGCGEGGDAVDFVMKRDGMDFIEALRHLAGMLGIIINEQQADRPSNYVAPSQLIPGIKEVKRHIRKAEQARLCFNSKEAEVLTQKGHNNTLFLPRFRPAHVQLIAKYTKSVIVYPRGLNRRKLLKALEALLSVNFYLKISSAPKFKPINWQAFLMQFMNEPEAVRGRCITLLSVIPDPIKRSTETQLLSHVIRESKTAT